MLDNIHHQACKWCLSQLRVNSNGDTQKQCGKNKTKQKTTTSFHNIAGWKHWCCADGAENQNGGDSHGNLFFNFYLHDWFSIHSSMPVVPLTLLCLLVSTGVDSASLCLAKLMVRCQSFMNSCITAYKWTNKFGVLLIWNTDSSGWREEFFFS